MRIRTLWAESEADDELPWLVAAVDEYTIDAHNGLPDFYKEQMLAEHRELIVDIPTEAVRALFNVNTVIGKVK